LLKINVLYLYAFSGWEPPGLIFVEAGKSISKKKIPGGEPLGEKTAGGNMRERSFYPWIFLWRHDSSQIIDVAVCR
jgi:hypothetical protein